MRSRERRAGRHESKLARGGRLKSWWEAQAQKGFLAALKHKYKYISRGVHSSRGLPSSWSLPP